MRRKVIQIADSTQLISLPRKWALKHGIKKGDELDIQEKGASLVVSTEQGDKVERVEVDVSKLGDFLIRFIGALYKSGYDELEFRYKDSKILQGAVSLVTEFYPGYEVMAQTDSKIVIKDIGQQLGTSFDSVLRRLFAVTLSLASSFKEALGKKDISSLSELMALEKSNNRFYNFCGRLLTKFGHKEYKVPFIYTVVWELEHIADEYKYLYKHLKGLGGGRLNISSSALELFDLSERMLRDYYTLFYKFNLSSVKKLSSLRDEILEKGLKIMCEMKGADVLIAYTSVTISEKVRDILGSYLSTVSYKRLTE